MASYGMGKKYDISLRIARLVCMGTSYEHGLAFTIDTIQRQRHEGKCDRKMVWQLLACHSRGKRRRRFTNVEEY